MFCSTCDTLINEEAQAQFRTKYPETEIISSSINNLTNSALVLLELSLRGRKNMEYEAVYNVKNFCINCGSSLKEE